MKIIEGTVYLDDSVSIDPGICVTAFRDKDNTKVVIRNYLLIHLYELLKFDIERQGIPFEKYVEDVIKGAAKELGRPDPIPSL